MKPCAICNAENQDSAVTCAACGEASFGAVVNEFGAKLLSDNLGGRSGSPPETPKRGKR